MSLTTRTQRLDLADAWFRVAPAGLHIIVHVGSNCLADAKTLAAQVLLLHTMCVVTMNDTVLSIVSDMLSLTCV